MRFKDESQRICQEIGRSGMYEKELFAAIRKIQEKTAGHQTRYKRVI